MYAGIFFGIMVGLYLYMIFAGMAKALILHTLSSNKIAFKPTSLDAGFFKIRC